MVLLIFKVVLIESVNNYSPEKPIYRPHKRLSIGEESSAQKEHEKAICYIIADIHSK